jgi:predicted anti-sigma-YlaC factor YlaD
MKNCQEITEDIEKSNVQKLSIRERLAVRMHLRLCGSCRQYAKDSKILERLLRLRSKKIDQYHFTPEEKAEIISKLKG